jgi:hypothetical protein
MFHLNRIVGSGSPAIILALIAYDVAPASAASNKISALAAPSPGILEAIAVACLAFAFLLLLSHKTHEQ